MDGGRAAPDPRKRELTGRAPWTPAWQRGKEDQVKSTFANLPNFDQILRTLQSWQKFEANKQGVLNRRLTKHRIEEHDMLNWIKANRKKMNAGELKEERVEKFRKLLELTEQYKRRNQYV